MYALKASFSHFLSWVAVCGSIQALSLTFLFSFLNPVEGQRPRRFSEEQKPTAAGVH